jgi:pimeloyl-ACP methyl ester carboxylesterase
MSTIVLVPGGGLGGWSWSRVTPLLCTAGHDPHPITLTGTGDRAHLNHPGIDLSAWVTDVVAHLETDELQDVVLVGHSFSGTVVSGVAERAPGLLARLVYLDALVPRANESVLAAIGSEQAGFLEALAEAHDGWSLPWFTDEQLDQFYGDHGLTAEDLSWIRRHVTAQPLATYREALPLTGVTVPRTFIRCTRGPMAPAVEPQADGWSWAELDAGHGPMITAPNATASLLDEIASDARGAP